MRIALLVTLTGRAAPIGQSMQQAAEMALFDTGAKELALAAYDSGESADTALEAYRTAETRAIVNTYLGLAAAQREVQPVDGPHQAGVGIQRNLQLVDAQHAVTAREMRHPGTPRFRAFGEAVHEHHGLRSGPAVGVVIDKVVQLAVGQVEE